MINMTINRDCMQLDIHFHQAAMEIIELEEVRSLDFPVRRHRSVLQAPLRRKKTKKSKPRYVFTLLLLVTKNRSLIMGKYITVQELYIYIYIYISHSIQWLQPINFISFFAINSVSLSFLPYKNHSIIVLYFLILEIF